MFIFNFYVSFPQFLNLKEIVVCLEKNLYWTLDVNWTAPYEITLARLSICLSVRSSLSFLKIESLAFSNIVHDNSWPWYLRSDKVRFLKKRLATRIWGQRAQIRSKMRFFVILLNLDHTFSLKLHTMIACDNIWYLVELKLSKKNVGAQIWVKRAKMGPKIRFFAIFSSLVH